MKPTTLEKVQKTVNSNNELVPKVKLTGTGKMPVMDMRSQSLLKSQQQQTETQHLSVSGLPTSGLHPPVSGLPPKSPVYAAVNKTKKLISPVKKQAVPLPQNQPAHLHNYCNVSPLLGDIINKKPEVFSQVQPEIVFNCLKKQSTNQKQALQQQPQNFREIDFTKKQQQKHLYENTEPIFVAHHENKMSNYLPMGPDSLEDLPIRPFEPTNYSENMLEDEPLGTIEPLELNF